MDLDMYWISSAAYALILIMIYLNDRRIGLAKRIGHSFNHLILWCIFFCLQDMLWGLCYSGIIRNDSLLFATSTLFHLSAVTTTFFWLKYVLDFVGERGRMRNTLLSINLVCIAAELVLLIANFFTPLMFTVRDGVFTTGYWRPFTFYSQFFIYLLIGVVALFYSVRFTGEKKEKFSAVFVFILAPILLGVAQMLYPGRPFYSMAFFISCFVVHFFIVSKDREKAMSDEMALEAFESVHNALGSANWQMNFDKNGQMTACVWSERFRKMIGYEGLDDFPDELSSWTDLLHPDDKEQVLQAFWGAVNDRTGQTIYSVRYRLRMKNGDYRWYSAHGSLSRYNNGAAKIFYGLFLDIHDRMQVEQNQEAQMEEITALNAQLQDNQARLEESSAEQEAQITEIMELNRSLADYNESMSNAGYGMWHIILKDGEEPRMQVNDKMAELLGVTGKDLSDEELYHAWYDQIVPDAIPSVQASVGEMMAGQFSENTYQWVHPTKGVIYVRCGGTAIKQDDGSYFIRGYHSDVTDLVYQEQKHTAELEKAREKAEQERTKTSEAYGMIEGLSQEYHTIWVVSKETSKMRLVRTSGVSTIQNAVQMGKDYPSFDAGFLKYIDTYVEPEDRERMHREIAFSEVLRHLQENPKELYAVNYLRRDDSGHVGYHQIAFANADTQDGKRQFVYGFRDVDQMVKEEQKQKEEMKKAKEAAEAANHAKTSFLFNMSHDIRTPMNAIIGYTNLIQKHFDDRQKCMDYLGKTQQANQFLLSLINNVLEMARIESGKARLDFTVSPVGGIAREIGSIFEDQMAKKGITFESHVETHSEWAFCDQARVREIYLNFLSNALKYTPEGGTVSMDVKELPGDQPGYIRMQVVFADNGIGMSKEFLPHLFDEFAREHTTTESRQQGTGLGMSIVKKIIDLMGGTIEVESELGKGSRFTVTYPLRTEGAVPEAAENDTQVLSKDFSGRRILLAEDNDLNAEIATEILKEAGFLVNRAEDGVVCVNMLEQSVDGYYDLILMDIQMPNMDGYKATRAIRQLPDVLKANIPIVAMTANAFEEDKQNALAAGMNGHLAKPIEVPKLMKTLGDILG